MSYFDFKFSVGDKVLFNDGKKKGEIVTRKVEESVTGTIFRYYVDAGGGHKLWYEDSQLRHDNGLPDASKEAQIVAMWSRINYCLDKKDFEKLPDLHTELIKLQGGESIV